MLDECFRAGFNAPMENTPPTTPPPRSGKVVYIGPEAATILARLMDLEERPQMLVLGRAIRTHAAASAVRSPWA